MREGGRKGGEGKEKRKGGREKGRGKKERKETPKEEVHSMVQEIT